MVALYLVEHILILIDVIFIFSLSVSSLCGCGKVSFGGKRQKK